MKQLLLAILVNITTVAIAQSVDTVINRTSVGDIKIFLVNSGIGTGTDSLIVRSGNKRVTLSPMDLPISTAQAAVNTGKQATLVSGTNIKTINGSTVLGSGDLVVSGAAAWGSVTGTLSNQTDLNNALISKQDALGFTAVPNTRTVNGQALSANVTVTTVSGNAGTATTLATPRTINGTTFDGSAAIVTDNDLLAYNALGSPILAETVGQRLFYSNVSTPLVDGQIKFTAVYLPRAATLTGIKVYVRTLGNYTADNNNRIGLYSYSAGNLTLVASSSNSGTLWTNAANSIQSIPFSSTYAASAGIYFVGLLFNQSAVVAAPAIATGIALNNLVMASTAFGFTNSAKLHGTANGTDLTTPIAMSAITASVIPSWISLY